MSKTKKTEEKWRKIAENTVKINLCIKNLKKHIDFLYKSLI